MKKIPALSYKILKYSQIVLLLLIVKPALAQQNILTLQQSRDIALKQNKQISIQNDSITIAQLGLKKAKTNALPSIDGMGTGTYLGKPLSNYLPTRSGSVSGIATEVLYNGGKVRNGIKIANVNEEVQEINLIKSKSDIILKTDSAYWEVVSLKQQLNSLKRSREYLASTLKEVTNAYKAGTKFKNDELQVQIQYNQNELQIFKTENALLFARMIFLQVIGSGGNNNIDVIDSIPFVPIATSMDSLYDKDADSRPEVKLLQKSVEAGELKTRIAFADMLPQVSLAGYGFHSASSSPGFVNLIGINGSGAPTNQISSSFSSWLALVSVKVPIFHWGYYRQTVRQQELRTHASRDQLFDAREKIVLDIRKNYYNLKEAEKDVALSLLSLEQATENLRLANDRMKAGTISTTDWLLAQNLWQQSFRQSITSKVDYNIYITAFKKATGDL